MPPLLPASEEISLCRLFLLQLGPFFWAVLYGLPWFFVADLSSTSMFILWGCLLCVEVERHYNNAK